VRRLPRHTPLSAGQVDDTPFGGGAGMVLRVDVVEAALRSRYGDDPVALRERRRVIALTPGGPLLDDALVDELMREQELTLLCGRYEGFDERILEHFCSDQLSIGRLRAVRRGARRDGRQRRRAAQASGRARARGVGARGVVQRRARRRPRVPALQRRPAEWRGWRVPDVLLSGHHARIRAWRAEARAGAGAASGWRFATIGRRCDSLPGSRGFFFVMSAIIDSLERSQLRRVPRLPGR
jgi:tRNA (guanine37-N1)-methyltransferase